MYYIIAGLTAIFSIIVIVCILVFLYKIIYKRSVKVNKCTYLWREILWPFNCEPFRLYKHLSPDNKGAFWNFTSNVFICIITFWAGLTLPLYINDINQQETERLARYQIVDKFYPQYMACVDSCSSVYKLLLPLARDFDEELNKCNKIDSIRREISTNIGSGQYLNDLTKATKMSLDYSLQVIPYIKAENIADSVRRNCYLLFLGEKVLSDSVTWETKDSATYVNDLKKEALFFENKMDYISNDINAMIPSFYSLIKNTSFFRKFSTSNYDFVGAINMFIFKPIIENREYISDEFFQKEEHMTLDVNKKNFKLFISDIRTKAVIILVFCIFIGYMLFRIVLMRAFDRLSLKPNPQLSQKEYEKLKQEKDTYNNENKQKQINELSLWAKIRSLENDLQEMNKQVQADRQEWSNKEKEYLAEIDKVTKINNGLKDHISRQENKQYNNEFKSSQ